MALRPGRGGVPGQGVEPTRGGTATGRCAPRPGLGSPRVAAGPRPGPDADPRRGTAEPLQGRLPGTLGDDQQGLQPCALAGRSGARARARQRRAAARSRTWATRRARTVTPGSKTLRSTSRAVARSKRRLGRSALTQARSASQRNRPRWLGLLGEVAVAVAAPDLGDMVPVHLAGAVASQAAGRRCPIAWRGRPRRLAGPRRGRRGKCPGTAPCRVARRTRGGCDRPAPGDEAADPCRRGGSSVSSWAGEGSPA